MYYQQFDRSMGYELFTAFEHMILTITQVTQCYVAVLTVQEVFV